MDLRHNESSCSIQVLRCSSQDNSQQFSLRDLSKLRWANGDKGEENLSEDQEKKKRRGFGFTDEQSALGFGADGDEDGDLKHHHKKRRVKRKNSDGEYEYVYEYDSEYEEYDEEIRNLTMEELQSALFQGSPEELEKFLKRLQAMSELEKQQLSHWLNAVKNLILSEDEINNLGFLDDMMRHAEFLLSKLKTPLTFLNFAIVGPRYSGKTTFLAVFLTKIADLLVANNQWKKSFVCYLNFRAIAEKTSNVIELYQQIVDITFSQLEKQVPELKPYSQKTIKFFRDLPSGTQAPSYPKRIAIDKDFPDANINFSRLAQKLYSSFKNEDALEKTVDLILSFPQEIGSIFTLPCVHYIIDHFENSNIPIQPSEKIASPSKKKLNQGIVVSRLKQMLNGKSFVICCQNEPSFLKILREIKGASPDMKTKVIISNIADMEITPDTKDESKRELHVTYKDGYSRIILTRDKCQGCIAFLAKWNHLMKLAKAVEEEISLIAKSTILTRKQTVKSQADIILYDFVKSFLPQVISLKDIPQSEISDISVIDKHGK